MRALEHKTKRILSLVVLCFALFALVGCSSNSTKHTTDDLKEATVVKVVDGDTFIAYINGTAERIRLIGIDASESAHPDESNNTKEAKNTSEYIKSILKNGSTVWVEKDSSNRDKYGKLLRYVWLELPNDPNNEDEVRSKMLNAKLVEEGWADPLVMEPNARWAYLFEELASKE